MSLELHEWDIHIVCCGADGAGGAGDAAAAHDPPHQREPSPGLRPGSLVTRDSAVTASDDSRVDYEVKLADVEPRRTAVVAATTTWQEFPGLWGQLLGEVWDCLRAGGIYRGCRNIMLYLDNVPNV